MRILICSNIYPPHFIGGAEIIAHNQAIALQRLGHEVRVFAGDIRELLERHAVYPEVQDGIPVMRMRLTGEDFSMDRPNFASAEVEEVFAQLLEEFRPDVVHCHNLIGLSVNLPVLAKRAGCRTVVTLHDFWGFCFKNTAERREGVPCADFSECAKCQPTFGGPDGSKLPIEVRKSYMSYALDHVDRFVSPSDYLAARYREAGFAADKVCTLWNGIDVGRFTTRTGTAREPIRFSFIGHFGRHKGIDVLVRAAAELARDLPFHINLIGEGDQEARLRALVEQFDLEDRTTFWGKVDNSRIADAYAATDVLVLPSVWPENQPVSITEAMASGLPVIASRIGGIGELVIDDVTGWTFAPGSHQELAEKMRQMITSTPARLRLGEEGRRRIEAFSFDRQAERLIDLYTAIPPDDRPPDARIALVSGAAPSPLFLDGIRRFLALYPDVRLNFASADWLPDESLSAVVATCRMDDPASQERLAEIEDFEPTLIPVSATAPREAIRALEGGLPYETSDDLAGLLAYLARAGSADEQAQSEKQHNDKAI